MDVHLRDLRALLAVAEEGTITGAAQRLHLAQPALSRQLQALERQLGVDLLVRLPRGVALTEEARLLLDPAERAVEAWDGAVRALRERRSVDRLVVGLQTAVGRGLQRRALELFRERCPGVVVSLRLVPWTDPSAGLGDATSDVAFLWLPAPAGLDVEVVATEPRHVVLPADHRLAGSVRVRFADLADDPFVSLPSAAGELREFWVATPDRGGVEPLVGAVADTADEAFEAVAAGLGVVLVAAGNAALYDRPGVVTRPVDGLGPAHLAVAWRADDRRREVAAFVEAVSTVAADRGTSLEP